jgi:hypothetical protein
MGHATSRTKAIGMRGNSGHLRQRGFGLGEPQGHVHGTVQVDRGGQFRSGLLTLVYPSVEEAEPQVAMRLERAHAKFLSQGQGLVVVGFGLPDLRGLSMCGDVTEEM